MEFSQSFLIRIILLLTDKKIVLMIKMHVIILGFFWYSIKNILVLNL